ncbi:hypothetical protein PISMIDRAFT_680833 [Pisolithus microcarpus 441]|uniref:Uncharacterized protein n=1 Tax=Pisolithus microcarpus 441 TaxID=765257 RepID=A0A0C9ZHU1_9AGAM|nr:hypothetical protein PISMIDRAFT_680833 [Pisolithus microcarpus 441]
MVLKTERDSRIVALARTALITYPPTLSPISCGRDMIYPALRDYPCCKVVAPLSYTQLLCWSSSNQSHRSSKIQTQKYPWHDRDDRVPQWW